MDTFHQANILLHVICGSTALLLGLAALLSVKGRMLHNQSGRLFLWFMAPVILTGLIGVFVFERNTFLLVITVLSGYVAYSGYRILQSKVNVVQSWDILVIAVTITVLAYFLYYFQSIGMIWSPVIIYSTVGALAFIIVYDLLRYFIPREWYKKHRIWLYEHIYKMTSAFSALLAAFVGTVLDDYQPHSQYLPSALGILVIIGFMIYASRSGLLIYRKNQ